MIRRILDKLGVELWTCRDRDWSTELENAKTYTEKYLVRSARSRHYACKWPYLHIRDARR